MKDKGSIFKRGTVVDASIIESAGRPFSEDKRAELASIYTPQIDHDTDSTKKNGTCHFGYKGILDDPSKLVRHSTQLEYLLSGDKRPIFGDKAYPSRDRQIQCCEQDIYFGM